MIYSFQSLEDIFSKTYELSFNPARYQDQVVRLRSNWRALVHLNLIEIHLHHFTNNAEIWAKSNHERLQKMYLFAQMEIKPAPPKTTEHFFYAFSGEFETTVILKPHPHSSKLLEEFFLIEDIEKDLERLRGIKKYEMEYGMLYQEYNLLSSILDLPVFRGLGF